MLGNSSSGPASLDRILVRSDTGHVEQVELTLVYAPRDSATEGPVRGVHKAPSSGDPLVVDDFVESVVVYSQTVAVESQTGAEEVIAFFSYGQSVAADAVQFEVVITNDGGLWLNLGRAGSPISMA